MLCSGASEAKKRYQRDSIRIIVAYVIVVACSAWFVKHDGHEHLFLYFWSVLPAIPILAVLVRMGRYLREEQDEFQR
jgi:Ca2+/Na+ antiporter